MTHILAAVYEKVEVLTIYPYIIYKITTNASIETLRNDKYFCYVREEDQAELM
jgi:hypothetical protein